MVVVDKVRHDKHGFLGKDGKWYANKFKDFDVSKGDEVEVVMKGDFLQEVKVLKHTPEENTNKPNSTFHPQEYHLSPEEVKLRALEFIGLRIKEAKEIGELTGLADKIVDWVNKRVEVEE